MALVGALRGAGRAAVVSGAGPSVLVLRPPPPGGRRRAGLRWVDAWRVLAPGIPPHGARVEVLLRG